MEFRRGNIAYNTKYVPMDHERDSCFRTSCENSPAKLGKGATINKDQTGFTAILN